ncbi:hypothetical protein [Leptospira sp. GIMC2001]|uniref:hypothetical protein n=1 Tax=Leptospira sp. GIMC2001 TaxID=1513297 RepID=UPI00234B7EF3|nr:hypothetical protein [Leptospira sp. GIMC2001]WCL48937.1 hypothetical protein O4O04_16815 [Leptospira sp. GIMC2001]
MKILILVSITLTALANCNSTSEKSQIPLGANIQKISSNPEQYKIISTAKAAETTLERRNSMIMQRSSCEGADLLAREKLKEVSQDPKDWKSATVKTSEKIFYQGEFCSKEFLFTPGK